MVTKQIRIKLMTVYNFQNEKTVQVSNNTNFQACATQWKDFVEVLTFNTLNIFSWKWPPVPTKA